MSSKTYSIEVQPDGTKMVMAGEKVMGKILGSLFLVEERGSCYRLGSERGWALKVDLLETLEEVSVGAIRPTDIETGSTYQTELSALLRKGVPVGFMGSDLQRSLPSREFSTHLWFPLSAFDKIK